MSPAARRGRSPPDCACWLARGRWGGAALGELASWLWRRACPEPINSSVVTETDPRQLPPQYAPGEVEARRYAHWEAAGLMRADAKAVPPAAPAFAMVIPPPNVTGSLHIGHALDHTLMDALVRRRRMQGYTALWLPGMDHAGIATQNVVERELAKEGLSRHDLGREKFTERGWQIG